MTQRSATVSGKIISMNNSPNIRLYAQMKPDLDGVRHLADVQSSLPEQKRGRAVAPKQLHMTLIHFGKVHDVFETLHAQTGISYADYAPRLAQYIKQSNTLLPAEPAVIHPRGFAFYGQRGGTLVIECETPEWIIETHARLVETLREFFSACGIGDIDEFMAGDINFMHVGELRAHITLYKGYAGDPPNVELMPVRVRPTPFVYPPVG